MKLFNYWRSSSSYRVRIALHFKGVDFEYVPVSLIQGEQHQAAHRSRNPIGTVPVLEVTEAGQVAELAQSVAIAEYLEERFPTPPLFPAQRIERAQVRAFAENINSGIQPLHNLSVLNYVKEQAKADSAAWATHFINSGLEGLERMATASAGRFSVGDSFTWADCCLVPQLFAARRFGGDVGRCPTLMRIEEACLALPAVQKAKPEMQPDAA
jgi:maleylpyruvate isomerase